MHVYTDGEDWWVATSLAAFHAMFEEQCGCPFPTDGEEMRQMPDEAPLTMMLDPENDERGQVGAPQPTTKPAGEWAREFFAKHKSGGLLGTVNL